MVAGSGNGTTPYYKTPESPHYAAISGYYNLPYLSMRNALWEGGKTSDNGLMTTTAVQTSDGSTPLDAGHQAISDMLVYYTQRTAQDLQLLPYGEYDTSSMTKDVPTATMLGGKQVQSATHTVAGMLTTILPTLAWCKDNCKRTIHSMVCTACMTQIGLSWYAIHATCASGRPASADKSCAAPVSPFPPVSSWLTGVENSARSILLNVTCDWIQKTRVSGNCPQNLADYCKLDYSSSPALLQSYDNAIGRTEVLQEGTTQQVSVELAKGLYESVLQCHSIELSAIIPAPLSAYYIEVQ